MQKLKVGVIDILGKSVSKKAFSKYSRANGASIMPQVVAAWCEELGHDVSYTYYNGYEVFHGGVPDDVDVVFIAAFSHSAMVAYALSAYFRAKGAVTVIGGPQARSYPDHSVKYFDYAVGFADKQLLDDILRERAPGQPVGRFLSAKQQPSHLPGIQQRWKFLQPMHELSPVMKVIPLIGSLGCPYTCSFCIDAIVPYQPLDYDALREELRFVVDHKLPRSVVAWHDPNFGIRFDDYMQVIEDAVPPGALTQVAETSLALLKEENCKRLQKNGFKVILPGIESWYDIGDKSKLRSTKGEEKVRRIAEHAKMIMSYIPYMQGNLIFGLDADEGPEPFELTKLFVDLAPGIYPYFSLLTSYGRNAPDNLRYQREGRVLNIPFHFLNQIHGMNVRPLNYDWRTFFDHVCDTYAYTFSPRALYRRFVQTNKGMTARTEQLFRGITSERGFKYKNMLKMRRRLDDPETLRYFNGETTELPEFFVEPIERDLGPLWDWLPKDAIHHDPNAYLKLVGDDAEQPAHAGMATA